MKINLFNLFRKKTNYRMISLMLNLWRCQRRGYPLFSSLEKSNIYAHSTCFMIKPEGMLVIEHLIDLFFHREVKISEVKEKVSDHNKVLVFINLRGLNKIL